MPLTKNQGNEDPAIKELDTIKRLLTLLLLKAGSPPKEVATALQVDRSVVSRMFPARKVKSFEWIKKNQ